MAGWRQHARLRSSYSCSVCNVILNSIEQYHAHLQGSKHQNKWEPRQSPSMPPEGATEGAGAAQSLLPFTALLLNERTLFCRSVSGLMLSQCRGFSHSKHEHTKGAWAGDVTGLTPVGLSQECPRGRLGDTRPRIRGGRAGGSGHRALPGQR
ncbi:hypothetical protein JZ751_007953 [Albula glossodonta]|uniref:C2H2-type domain-containing protein n=1 Tax=Albula glossodonta TaxID=121402 RepID=A0A8T2P0L1_9TELE|nr:hypothetical protein JZ751_007953 [Albula glossodonta]